jgi:hypothetical protein
MECWYLVRFGSVSQGRRADPEVRSGFFEGHPPFPFPPLG